MALERPSQSFSPYISALPWSRRGSFLSLSLTSRLRPSLGLAPHNDVYLVSQCVALSMPMFALRPLPGGLTLGTPLGFHEKPSATTVSATISSIQWHYENMVVCEATFQDLRSIRIRGNVPLAFDTDIKSDPSDYMGIYLTPRPAFGEFAAGVEVVYKTFPGYRFLMIRGDITTVNGTSNAFGINRRIQVQGTAEDSAWELIMHELDVRPKQKDNGEDSCKTVLREASTTSFEDVKKAMAIEFDEFCLKLCPWAEQRLSSAETLASYVTWTSMVRPAGRFTREAVLMSKLWMNKIWSWDNCFNAIALIPYNIVLAVDQLHVLYDHQAPSGRLPDSVDWQNVEWSFTKPPVQGWALGKLLDAYPEISDEDLLELYTCTAKLTDFWLDARRGNKSDLPYWNHGNDSGWDNSTAFDSTPVVITPDCSAFLIIQADCLALIARRLGLETAESEKWTSLKKALLRALISELWDGNSFLLKDAITGETCSSTSLLRLVPLVAARHLPSNIVEKMSTDLLKHLGEWGLATEEFTSSEYESDGYWRGPIWAPSTYLIESGLREGGNSELANTISSKFMALCEKSGFAENFDAVTGEGLRDLSYTWTSAVYLVFRREAFGRERKYTLNQAYD